MKKLETFVEELTYIAQNLSLQYCSQIFTLKGPKTLSIGLHDQSCVTEQEISSAAAQFGASSFTPSHLRHQLQQMQCSEALELQQISLQQDAREHQVNVLEGNDLLKEYRVISKNKWKKHFVYEQLFMNNCALGTQFSSKSSWCL